jgi:hypothetical protein
MCPLKSYRTGAQMNAERLLPLAVTLHNVEEAM